MQRGRKNISRNVFLGVNLCFPSTIYKTEIYKQHIFDWEPYKKLGDRPSTIYYASFGKKGQTLIFLENYIYYRVHAQQDLNNKATALSEQELRNYFLLYKNVLTSGEKIYKNIYTYFSKNFVLLIVSSFGYKMRDFRQSYTHKGVLKKIKKKKNKIKTLKEFENKFLPDMTLDDIFALNFSNYSKQISISNKGKNFITTENISGNGQLKIDVNGFNNNITVKNCTIEKGICTILVRGDNHRVEISDEWIGKNLSVFINPSATSVSHLPCHIQINGGTIEDLSIVNPHGGTGVIIKKNHMISMGVSIQNTDSHPIYDAHTKQLLNKPSKDIIINENCWLGMNTTLLKEVVLPQGTIVGFGTVVTHSIEEEQCIVAGVPAKIVKHNVLWKQKDENFF